MRKKVNRAKEVYGERGSKSLLYKGASYIMDLFRREYLKQYYRVKYDKEIAPRPGEEIKSDPSQIDYSISNSNMPDSTAQFGILEGDWDQQKTHWQDTWAIGLVERFEEEKDWKETRYYQTGIRRLRDGDSLGRLDGQQTVENFRSYLRELDKLFDEISTGGYDQSSKILVSIGRDGEIIVHHGNHRRAMARIAGIDVVPIQIKYRHKRWQAKRKKLYEMISKSDLSEAKFRHKFEFNDDQKMLDHPDMQQVIEQIDGEQ